MARFFQHVLEDENLGKVTRLKYIDDITDDEMVLFYFTDGTYCNSEYIGRYDVSDVHKANCAMVELTSPTNKWKFEKHIVLPEESPQMVAKDGQMYEAVLPGTSISEKDANGNATQTAMQKSGTRIDIRPPKIISSFEPESDNDFLLSIHPNLETAEDVVDNSSSNQQEQNDMSNIFQSHNNSVATTDKPIIDLPEPEDCMPIAVEENYTISDIEMHSHISIIDVDELSQSQDDIVICVNGKKEIISISELSKRLSVSSEEYDKAKNAVGPYDNFNEDVLIKNMIDKSKRQKCAITMKVNYELPPKEVYDTIKSVYEDGLAEQFVKGLAMRMPYEKMIAAFSNGLASYYDHTLVKNEIKKI